MPQGFKLLDALGVRILNKWLKSRRSNSLFNQNISLNDYQQLMLRISDLAPYNAVHAVPLNSTLDRTQLENAIERVIHHLGLGRPEFSHNRQSVHFVPIQHPILVEERSHPLAEHMALEMNTPFTQNALPVRFYIVTVNAQSHFTVTYNHWIADAYSIIKLVEAIFLIATKNQWSSNLNLNAPEMAQCFPTIYGKHLFYYRYPPLLGKIMQYARAYRTPIANIESTTSGCCYYFFSEQDLFRLLHLCKAQHMTLNDLFITVLAQVFGKLTAQNRQQLKPKFLKPKRNHLVISVISNIRKQSKLSLTHSFGVFLGFFSLFIQEPERYSFTQLQRIVAAKTQAFKRNNTAVKQSVLFKVQNKRWDNVRTQRSQYRLFSKTLPITVGISNLSLDGDPEVRSDLYHHYIRCSPTAMVCPMVFNITTQNNQMSVVMSYRKACFTNDEAVAIQAQFITATQKLIAASPLDCMAAQADME